MRIQRLAVRRSYVAYMFFSMIAMAFQPCFADQSYPTSPIKLIVPFGAGGLNDTTARIWTNKVAPQLGQSFIIENRPSGGGVVGTLEVARAKPDGYTLLLGSSTTQVIIPLATEKPRYDPVKDFQAISLFAVATAVIAINPSVPAKNVSELITFIRSKSGELAYGSAGTGSNSHLAGEMFKKIAGDLDLVHAPYRSGNAVLQDLLFGHLLIATPHITAQTIELHREGKIRILAVAAERRLPSAPEIETGIEAGIPNWIAQTFNGILAPAGVPKDIVKKIADASARALDDPEFVEQLSASGFDPLKGVDADSAQAYIEKEVQRLRPVIKMTGFKLD